MIDINLNYLLFIYYISLIFFFLIYIFLLNSKILIDFGSMSGKNSQESKFDARVYGVLQWTNYHHFYKNSYVLRKIIRFLSFIILLLIKS